ncbi:hypothetical protein [Phormidesmis priestleyi]|uniref:hypothetical protein n=1 Tax=Phormidesmis priestleyi TaxID=268141 RepID=UPI000B05944B|nr:hypothetical protein [Phormidesmis priestleyi]
METQPRWGILCITPECRHLLKHRFILTIDAQKCLKDLRKHTVNAQFEMIWIGGMRHE